MIVARLCGGLGNQMFQYAAGRALADRIGTSLILDIRAFRNYTKHTGYALDRFNIRAEVAVPPELRGLPNWTADIGQRLPLVRPFLRRWYFEPHFSYDESLASQRDGIGLVGYWQSERYFADAEEAIRHDFTLRAPIAEDDPCLTSARTTDSVALHVRRGDYVTDPSASRVHGSCSLDYYRRAIDLMQSLRPACHFVIFSDDLPWARRKLPLGPEATFVSGNGDRPERDLTLMAACNHHIIANSSFSWWGAWLGRKPGQVVAAPVPWFESDRHDARDLLVANWHYLRRI